MSGTYSMLGVILTALGQLNKRYLIMEGAAAGNMIHLGHFN